MDGPVCHVCLTPLTYHEGGVECAKLAPVVYVAIMRFHNLKPFIFDTNETLRTDAAARGRRLAQNVGYTFLGTRAVPLEPDSEGTP